MKRSVSTKITIDSIRWPALISTKNCLAVLSFCGECRLLKCCRPTTITVIKWSEAKICYDEDAFICTPFQINKKYFWDPLSFFPHPLFAWFPLILINCLLASIIFLILLIVFVMSAIRYQPDWHHTYVQINQADHFMKPLNPFWISGFRFHARSWSVLKIVVFR